MYTVNHNVMNVLKITIIMLILKFKYFDFKYFITPPFYTLQEMYRNALLEN